MWYEKCQVIIWYYLLWSGSLTKIIGYSEVLRYINSTFVYLHDIIPCDILQILHVSYVDRYLMIYTTNVSHFVIFELIWHCPFHSINIFSMWRPLFFAYFHQTQLSCCLRSYEILVIFMVFNWQNLLRQNLWKIKRSSFSQIFKCLHLKTIDDLFFQLILFLFQNSWNPPQ